MSNMNVFERTIDALQKQGLNSDEILEELKVLFRRLTENTELVTAIVEDDEEILEDRVKKLHIDKIKKI